MLEYATSSDDLLVRRTFLFSTPKPAHRTVEGPRLTQCHDPALNAHNLFRDAAAFVGKSRSEDSLWILLIATENSTFLKLTRNLVKDTGRQLEARLRFRAQQCRKDLQG